MEVIHPRCAGIDVSKKDAKVCIRIQGRGAKPTTSAVTTWTAMTGRILDPKEHLLNEHVTLVVMEATSDYWRPFYYLLEDEGLAVMLVNAREARNVPGRKTDVSDAAWLADLGAHGLVRASFVPPPPIRELRDLTRASTIITRERTREIQRLEKLLEDACIKLSFIGHILGFWPQEGLVCLTVDTNHIGATLHVDLPRHDGAERTYARTSRPTSHPDPYDKEGPSDEAAALRQNFARQQHVVLPCAVNELL